MDILELLAEQGLVDRVTALKLKEELRHEGASEEKVLMDAGLEPSAVLAVKAKHYGIPHREVAEGSVSFDVLHYIPEESARHYGLVPLGVVDGVLEVGIIDPDNLEARDVLTFISAKSGMPYKVFLISRSDFAKVLEHYRGLSGEVGRALGELEVTQEQEGRRKDASQQKHFDDTEIAETSSTAISEDAPVTKIVATVLRHAGEERASDIHIEPLFDKTRVRFRVDGVLKTNLTLPQKVHAAVVARIKVLSNMRLDERRKPQDGRFSARIGGSKVDLRVSTFPTYYGEKVVMRILGSKTKDWRLDSIGLSERDLELIRSAIKKPYGLVLISGPTGSGKSTTLYTILNEVDRDRQNVLSLEDPVEYTIPGVSQSQVRPEIGYSFANGLRTTLRQDPNIIMVGEIRDSETANLAVQAALTGHLVLSTIHTNNAIGIVPRLLDMGVEPYLIPPVLILGMAQRLVQTLCEGGGEKVVVEDATAKMITEEFADLPEEYRKKLPSFKEVHRLKPTPECPTGTSGRIACFEVFDMTQELERAILAGKSEEELFALVRLGGMLTMKEDAIIKSAKGIVPFEEVNTLGGEFELAREPEPSAESPTALSETGEVEPLGKEPDTSADINT